MNDVVVIIVIFLILIGLIIANNQNVQNMRKSSYKDVPADYYEHINDYKSKSARLFRKQKLKAKKTISFNDVIKIRDI